jgi:NADPH:quinone reductase-like Zn-dependent oxidoreductase
MRAVIHDQVANKLTLDTQHAIPTPNYSAREHLLRISATALTRGELAWPRPAEDTDYSPGCEMAGIVAEAPPDSKFKEGTKVFLRVTYPRCGGARGYTIGLESELAERPGNLSTVEAAAVPVSALTAWQALVVHGGLDVGEDAKGDVGAVGEGKRRVLVNGAAGAVGLWTVQLAKALGLEVVGTANGAKAETVRSFGADEVVDYTKGSVREWAAQDAAKRKVDLVFDTVGGESLEDVWWAAKDGGVVLSIVPPADMVWRWVLEAPQGISETVSGKFFIMDTRGDHLAQVAHFIEQGKAKPVVDSVFPLEEAQKAFDRAESGRAAGKVVIKVADD